NGVTIPVIFEIEGEDGFRRREQEVLADLAQEKDLVLSTGGGIVLKPENREVLRNHGFVVYLNARPELLAERTKHDRTRPLLNVEDPLTRLRELYAVRDPLYREVAHAIVETGRGAPQQVVQAILGEISRIDR
ncbi:MAG: shikimate kinase, partial [Fluviibacter sp.]